MPDVTPTKSENAEAAVLGSIILDRSVIPDVKQVLYDEIYFSTSQNQILYRFFLDLDEEDTGWDLVIFRDRLNSIGKYNSIGGVEYLKNLADTVPHSQNAVYYAKIVFEKSKARKLLEYANNLIVSIRGFNNIDDTIGKAEKELSILVEQKDISGSLIFLNEAIGHLDISNVHKFIKTEFKNLDKKIYGLGNGQVIIIAGRPGSGKTSFALNIARNLCEKNKKIAVFSLEMTADDIMQRMISNDTRISLSQFMNDYLCRWENEIIEKAKEKMKTYNIILDNTKPLYPAILKNRCYLLKKKHNIDLVIIDYLQLMRSDTKNGSSRYEQMTEISASIKSIALSLDIPIILVSQLSRANENRTEKRPRMSDLRDSGGIEQDADLILMLHRPAKYAPEKFEAEYAELIIEKNRRGSTGIIEMNFEDQYCNFSEVIPEFIV